jgi:hypothetical protein
MKNYLITTTIQAEDVVHALKRLANHLEGTVKDSDSHLRPIKISATELAEDFVEEVPKEEAPKADFNERDVENRNQPSHSHKPASVGATPTTGMSNLFGGTSWGK